MKQPTKSRKGFKKNIFKANILDHYIQRPDIFENMCLAYFGAYYSFSRHLKKSRHQEEEDDFVENDDTNLVRYLEFRGLIPCFSIAPIQRYHAIPGSLTI